MKLSIGQHSTAGRKNRNEDSFGILMPKGSLLSAKGVAITLADGMSGSEAARIASDTCVKGFLTDYYDTPESWSVQQSAEQVLGSLNRWLHAQGQSAYLARCGMVSTFSAIILKQDGGHLFHVGDSRIYRLRDGALEQLTRDHRIPAGKGQSYLSRGMGADPDLDVDYRCLALEEGDIFVLTTDGVHEYAAANDMVRLVTGNLEDLDQAARYVTDAAFAAGSNDNLTCQIVRIDALDRDGEAAHLSGLSALPFPPPLDPGMILDGYRIIREIHASQRNQVYLAEDLLSGLRVCLKTPSLSYADDADYIEAFQREDWAGRRVTSPHLLKVLAPSRERSCLYSVSEFVDGLTLRQWLYDHPEAELATIRDILGQLAKGLRALHRREMIHQDLKPENVMIDRDGVVKIIDFGSVRLTGVDKQGGGAMVVPGGTQSYRAPEYLLKGSADRRADLYSLGVLAYEMMTGALPYGKGFANAASIHRLDYRPASRINPDVPYWVDGALKKAVAKEPGRRYAVLSEFIADLSKPNPAFRPFEQQPFLERDPVRFWQWTSLVLAMIAAGLLGWVVLLKT
ncbi:bifunctional protein-serine/threonine kinase/phosphatase [Aestuariispira insulae]|uniref:Serine/threonine protein phosphatase PrpC n=1 Tax=Aestuariispira insulae TaxID=1461337 RepID=A0A3D9HSB8_9PROT|nr:bifunctional protein-serine/threonine kinase/phosphatase [Aestuariispira insulae]RED52315.1 serine/threonine protein phosphatase PrpC [Aestuariispira insulae]